MMPQVTPLPKPKIRKHRAKNNKVPTGYDLCEYHETPYASTHEVFQGSGRRQLSIKYKMQIKLCQECHAKIHDHPLQGLDLELKKKYQEIFECQYGHEFYMQEFGRNYLEM